MSEDSWEYLDVGPAARRRWWHGTVPRVVAVAIAAFAAVAVVLHDAGQPSATDRRANSRAIGIIRLWLATSAQSRVNTISSGAAGECRAVRPGVSPVARVEAALRTALPGFRMRTAVTTIDQAAQLCMMQARVSDAAGNVVVLRVVPAWDANNPSRVAGLGPIVQSSTGTAVGFVAARSPDGWTVVVGWAGDDADQPDPGAMLSVARTEAVHW